MNTRQQSPEMANQLDKVNPEREEGTPVPNNPGSQAEPTQSLYDGYITVGDSSYKNLDALKEGKMNADAFIKTLKDDLESEREERRRLEEELNNRARIEDLLDRHETSRREGNTTFTRTPDTPASPSESVISTDTIINEVLGRINKTQEQAKVKSNVETFETQLNEMFQENARGILSTKANQLGLKVNDIVAIASKSPQAAIDIIKGGLKVSPNSTGYTGSTARVPNAGGAFSNSARDVSIEAQIEGIRSLRQNNPAEYRRRQGDLCRLEIQLAQK